MSDTWTTQLQKQIELKKELGNELGSALDESISNLTEMVDRELNILRLQRENIQPEKLNYFDADSITAPSVLIPNAKKKDKVSEAKEETRKLIDEERERQEKINEIKKEALDKIYEKAEQDRADEKEDILDNISDINDQIAEVQDQLTGKANSAIIATKQNAIKAAEEVRDQIQNYINSLDFSNLSNLGGLGNLKTSEDLKKSGYKPVDFTGSGYKDNPLDETGEHWDSIAPQLKNSYVVSGSDGKIGYFAGIEDGKAKFNFENGSYSYSSPAELGSNGNQLYRMPDESNAPYSDNYREQKKKGKKFGSFAYSDSSTSIAKGPITVGEHHPEFVMFKNGEGAIFDKTTILNGNEVDFVTDASYANNGKNNGAKVSNSVTDQSKIFSSYAWGGNEQSAQKRRTVNSNGITINSHSNGVKDSTKELTSTVEEGNKDIIDNVEDTNDTILTDVTDNNDLVVTNIEDTNALILDGVTTSNANVFTNISDNNALIEGAIATSNQNNLNNYSTFLGTNENNIVGSLNNVSTVTAQALTQIQNLFVQAYNNIINAMNSSNFSSSVDGSGVTGSIPYFNQGDYSSTSYNGNSTIAKSGCGPTAVAMVLSGFGANVDPVAAANYATKNGVDKGSWALFPSIAKQYGVDAKQISTNNSEIEAALKERKPVIVSLNSGTKWTKNGHFVVLTDIDSDGKVTMLDPGSRERSNKKYDLSTITSDSSASWIFSKGGKGLGSSGTNKHNIPKGAAVWFWSPNDSTNGHVGIWDGNGKVYHNIGSLGHESIESLESKKYQ